MMTLKNTPSIGLVELPSFGLFTAQTQQSPLFSNIANKGYPLVSKQILLSNLRASGFNAELINLKQGNYQEEFGKVTWRDTEYSKVYLGGKIQDIDPSAYDVWGVTNNFVQDREIACLTIKHLVSGGRPVIVGGSDAIAEPRFYLAAGAAAVILDKSGAANAPVIDYVLGKTPREMLSGVILASGIQPPQRVKRLLHPQDWAIPDESIIKQCVGTQFRSVPLPEERLKLSSIIMDMGCDRSCDFCQTPSYRIGYRPMSPARVSQWLEVQKTAGVSSLLSYSDQFLGRILKAGGRDEIIEIMRIIRELGLAVLWDNGLELKKTTLGRGIQRKNQSDMRPDEELIKALWGWDGKVGSYQAFIPAERPVLGRENYTKLLPWKEHCQIVKLIVAAGVPNICYGIIIGFEDDSNDSMLQLEDLLSELYADILAINPEVNFQIYPMTLLPIPGTKQWGTVQNSGLLRISDTSLHGGFGTSALDTRYLSYEQIADWQERLVKISTPRQF
jgi:radical SAM superfamily enzyme YgiQ (UPF0313 family)